MRFGQLGAPLLTPFCMNTVNGRPVVIVAMPANLPAARDRAEHAAVGQPVPPGAEWQLVDPADDRAVPHVEAGRPVTGLEIGDRLRVADGAAAACRRAAVVERLAIGVAAQELQAAG